nr:MAG TPA: DNA TRANSLOCASE FTSK [Caudoviricetes sp.]
MFKFLTSAQQKGDGLALSALNNYQADEAAALAECNGVLKLQELQALNAAGLTLAGSRFLMSSKVVGVYRGDFLQLNKARKKLKEITENLETATGRAGCTASIIYDEQGAGLKVEIPLQNRRTLGLREILDRSTAERMALPLCIGEYGTGQRLIIDLAEAPHLLISGTTGSGKSVCLNDIILSLINYNTCRNLKLILIDPKGTELKNYRRVPHLQRPIITDSGEALEAFRWAYREMEKRFKRLDRLGVHDLNERPELFPRLVIAVDEFANLGFNAQNKKEMLKIIAQISAKGRAAGVHLIICTQSPRAVFLPPEIKVNFTSRLVFRASSVAESKIMLDRAGAERLTGKGDGLYLSTDSPEPVRFQAAFVSNQEVKNAVKGMR